MREVSVAGKTSQKVSMTVFSVRSSSLGIGTSG
jgi:hypothetical protein